MKWTNYHTHTKFCDGNAWPVQMIEKAIEQGVYAYGFSGHSPVPFESDWNMQMPELPEYFQQIDEIKEKYGSQIHVFKGMEVDYIAGLLGPKNFRQYNLDYIIGSVHYIKRYNTGDYCTVDHTADKFNTGLIELFDSKIEAFSKFYYQQVMDLLVSDKPDIVGHIDLIKKFNKGNRFFDENDNWYKMQVSEVLQIVKEQGVIIEINTRGKYKNLTDEFYPSDWILRECKKLGISVTISADAHTPAEISKEYENVAVLLNEIGIREIMILDNQGWRPVGFSEKGLDV
jgi:histidinol-phosphatase (PHP family)